MKSLGRIGLSGNVIHSKWYISTPAYHLNPPYVLWGSRSELISFFIEGGNLKHYNYSRGSHIHIACRSVCNQDQNGIKQSTFFIRVDQGFKTNSEGLISTDQVIYSRMRWRSLIPVTVTSMQNGCWLYWKSADDWLIQATCKWLTLKLVTSHARSVTTYCSSS